MKNTLTRKRKWRRRPACGSEDFIVRQNGGAALVGGGRTQEFERDERDVALEIEGPFRSVRETVMSLTFAGSAISGKVTRGAAASTMCAT